MSVITNWNDLTNIYTDIRIIKELIYDKYKINCTNLVLEKEHTKYGGCSFKINSCNIKLRIAKITPTKNGQFVTLWKRNLHSLKMEPYNIKDNYDFYIIICRKKNKLGQFIFPKKILYQYGILSSDENDIKNGKRAFRVYPSWDEKLITTDEHKWQLDYFIEIITDNNNNNINKKYIKKIFNKCYN